MEEGQFSLNKYLSNWQQIKDTIVVEGTVQADGDSIIIDRDPCLPGFLLRIRKQDVTDKRESRKVKCHGQDHQLYLVSIKRGVPVLIDSVIESDRLVSVTPQRHKDEMVNSAPFMPHQLGVSSIASRKEHFFKTCHGEHREFASNEMRRFDFPEDVWSLSLKRDGSQLAVFTTNSLSGWNTNTGEKVWENRVATKAGKVQFSPNGTDLLYVEVNSNDANVTDRAGSVRGFTHPQGSVINSLSFNGDGTTVLTGANDGSARLWKTWPSDLPSLDPIAFYEYPTGNVANARISADERWVVISGNGPTALYDASTGRRIREGLTTGGLFPIVISPDGTRLVTVTGDNRVVVHDVETFNFIRQLEYPLGYPTLWNLSISSNGLRLVGTGSIFTGSPYRVFVWDFPSGRLIQTFSGLGHSGPISCNDISDDGRLVATGSFDHTVRLWNVQ